MKPLLPVYLVGILFLAVVSCNRLETDGHNLNAEKPITPKSVKPGVQKQGDYLIFSDLNFEACMKSQSIGKEGHKDIYADSDGDGRLSLSEASKVKTAYCPGMGIRNIEGIEVFENLEYINCSANELGNLPHFTGLEKLKVVRCVNNYFSDADCLKIKALKISGLETLEIEKQRDGRKLTCDQVELVAKERPADPGKKNIFEHNTINDVWGFVHNGREFGVYGDVTNIYLVEVFSRDPYLKRVATIPRGKKDAKLWSEPNHSAWGEYRYYSKSGKAYLYASSEGHSEKGKYNQIPSLMIIDITEIEKPVVLEVKDIHEGLRSNHNIALDQERGLLITFGGTDHNGPEYKEGRRKGRKKPWLGAGVYSLEDPTNPKFLMRVGKYYVHDGQIKTTKDSNGRLNTRLYLAHGSTEIHWDANKTTNKENRFAIYDISSLNANEVNTLLDQQYPNGYCHNIWSSEDDSHLVLTGETSLDDQLSLWEIVKSENGKLKAEFRNGLNLQGGSLAHNAFILGNHVYASHYTKGVHIAEIVDAAGGKKELKLKWAFDTYEYDNSSDMSGSWGVFPFTTINKDLFLVTDTSNGFYVFKKSPEFMKSEQ